MPRGAKRNPRPAVEQAVGIDAAGESQQRIDRGQDQEDRGRVLPERHADGALRAGSTNGDVSGRIVSTWASTLEASAETMT